MVKRGLPVIALGLASGVLACKGDAPGASAPENPADEGVPKTGPEALVQQLVEGIMPSALADFASHAEALSEAEGSDDLRSAWQKTMDAWQVLEVLQIGPAGAAGPVVGGQDLRDEIYSWPTTNECRLDQEVVREGYKAEDFFQAQHPNVYGLDAMEYLLYAPPNHTECPSLLPIISDGSWAALGDQEVERRRTEYAARLADEVSRRAKALSAAWDPDQGDWGTALMTAGDDGSPYEDIRQATDQIFGALFYMDTSVRDLKIGKPCGIIQCSQDTCPDAAESLWAHRGNANIAANIRAARSVMEAFGPWMEDLSAGDMVAQMIADLDASLEALEALPGDVQVLAMDNPAPLRDLHAVLKKFTDQLKGPFVTVANLRIPDEGSGDND